MKLDDLESFLQDSERVAALDNKDDTENHLGEGECVVIFSMSFVDDTCILRTYPKATAINCDIRFMFVISANHVHIHKTFDTTHPDGCEHNASAFLLCFLQVLQYAALQCQGLQGM